MFTPRLWAAAVVLAAAARPAAAQRVTIRKSDVVSVRIPPLSTKAVPSALDCYERVPGAAADCRVRGTVQFSANAASSLQVRLTTAWPNQLTVYPVNGSATVLTPGTWVTVASPARVGPTAVPVEYLVRWGRNMPKNKQNAETPPVEYRVVPR